MMSIIQGQRQQSQPGMAIVVHGCVMNACKHTQARGVWGHASPRTLGALRSLKSYKERKKTFSFKLILLSFTAIFLVRLLQFCLPPFRLLQFHLLIMFRLLQFRLPPFRLLQFHLLMMFCLLNFSSQNLFLV